MTILLTRLAVAVIPLVVLISGIVLFTSLRQPQSRRQLRARSALRSSQWHFTEIRRGR